MCLIFKTVATVIPKVARVSVMLAERGEVSSFPRDVAEMALAHVIENKVEAAYRRGDLFAKRRKMMQAWANYLERLNTGSEVVPNARAAKPSDVPASSEFAQAR